MIRVVHVENEGCFQALPTDVYFVRVRLGRSIQQLSVEGVTYPARFQESSRFRKANEEALTRHL